MTVAQRNGRIGVDPTMLFSVLFYRIREGDGARATIARADLEAEDLAAAIQATRNLFEKGGFPQNPDAVTILDGSGSELCTFNFPDGALNRLGSGE